LTPNLNLKRLLERAAVLLCALPRSELLLRDFPRYAVHLADLFREPLAVAGDDFELFLAQLDPVALGVALEVLPVHFDAFPVHARSFGGRRRVWAYAGYHGEMAATRPTQTHPRRNRLLAALPPDEYEEV